MGAIQFIHISDVNIGRKADKLLFGQTCEKDGITTLKQVVSDAGNYRLILYLSQGISLTIRQQKKILRGLMRYFCRLIRRRSFIVREIMIT